MKKLLPTSTAGSLPKPSWLAQPEKLWSPWKLQDEELIEGKQDALRLSLQEQQQAGIDIVSDGEQTRQHFVTTFIEHLSGVDFDKRETVRIRDRYDASVPTVVGAVSRTKPVFVEDAKFLRQQTSQPIKWALPGPMTMIDTLYDSHYKSREKLAWEFAKILNQEARELEAAGVDIISLECHNSRVPIDLIELIRGKKVMVGAIDVASNTIETPEQVADTLRKALRFVDADKLYPSTNCGMAPLSRQVARGKLHALSAGAEIIRREIS